MSGMTFLSEGIADLSPILAHAGLAATLLTLLYSEQGFMYSRTWGSWGRLEPNGLRASDTSKRLEAWESEAR